MTTTAPVSRWKIWLAAAALVLAGAGLGSIATVFVAGRFIRHAIERAGTHPELSERVMARVHSQLVSKLHLDASQSADVRRALDSAAARVGKLRGETRAELREILRDTAGAIDARLGPEQSREFHDDLRARLRRIGFAADADRILEGASPKS